MDTIPLSNLVPAWAGHIIPEAYAAVAKGLRSQRSRFRFDRYIVISFVDNLDYDGCWDYLYLDAGLRTPREAAETCQRVLRHRMLEAQVQYGPATLEWHKLDDVLHKLKRFSPRVDMMAWERWGDGSGFNQITVYVGVLEVNPNNPLTIEDLEAIGHDWELRSYLQHEGIR
jgi:hypothetical protein